MTTTISTPPADPESAALDLIVDAAEAATGSTAFRAVLQDLAGALHAEGALAGLKWSDARLVAAAISYDACMVDDPARTLRARAKSVRATCNFGGVNEIGRCVDPAGVAQALDAAATMLDVM